MNCSQFNDYIMKHFDGNINDIESAQLKLHIKTCKECREEFESMSEIFNVLEAESVVEPPEDFEARVMEKVNALENRRKERMSTALVLLYNLTTVASMVLLLIYVANLKELNLWGLVGQIGEYFGSFSSVTTGLYAIAGDIYNIVAGAVGIVFQVFFAIIKAYYYVFITLLALLLAIQKLFFVLVEQDRGEAQ